MNKKEIVFKIIGQLKRTEKRSFRLEMEKFKSSSTYILIYDYFEKSTELDDKKLEAFCKEHDIRYLSSHILHLHAKLMDFLVRNKEITVEDDISRNIKATRKEAHIYAEYGMFEQSAKSLKKACETAYEYDKYYLMPYMFLELMLISRIPHKYSMYIDNLPMPGDSPVEKMQWITNKISGISLNAVIRNNLSVIHEELFPSPERDAKLEKLQEYEPVFYSSDDGLEFTSYYTTIIQQAHSAGDIIRYISLAEEFLEQLQKFFITGTNPAITWYIEYYFCLCRELFWQDPEAFDVRHRQYKSKIEDLIATYKLSISGIVTLYMESLGFYLKQYALLLKSSFDSTAIKSYFSSIKADKSPTSKGHYLIQLATASLQFVIIRDYSNSDDCYKELQSMPKKLYIEQILHDEVELIEMIKIFELNDRVYLANMIKAIRHKHYTSYYVSPINELIVKLINKMQKATADKHLELMKAALPELQKLEKTIVLKYVPFSYWLKWRIEEYE